MKTKEDFTKADDELEGLEESGRKMQNQNFADVVATARARLAQVAVHPDYERARNIQDGKDEGEGLQTADPLLNSGGNQVFAVNDPGMILQQQEAARRAVFESPPVVTGTPFPNDPANPPPAPAPGGPDAIRPGDPEVSFQDQNPNFQHPDNVELNPDGTVKQAPNALGKADDRGGGDDANQAQG